MKTAYLFPSTVILTMSINYIWDSVHKNLILVSEEYSNHFMHRISLNCDALQSNILLWTVYYLLALVCMHWWGLGIYWITIGGHSCVGHWSNVIHCLFISVADLAFLVRSLYPWIDKTFVSWSRIHTKSAGKLMAHGGSIVHGSSLQ